MVFPYLLCYLSERGHICTRQDAEGKCALLTEDNKGDIKNPCDNLYIACLASNAMFYKIFTD